MADSTTFNVNLLNAMAPNGYLVIADTNTHIAANEATKPSNSSGWMYLIALGGDVVFSAVAGGTGVDGLATRTLSNGASIPGQYGSIKLTSGVLVAVWN